MHVMYFIVAKRSELIQSHISIAQLTKRDDKHKIKKKITWNLELSDEKYPAENFCTFRLSFNAKTAVHLQLNHDSFLLYINSTCTLTCTCQLVY